MKKTPEENISEALMGNPLIGFIGADNVKKLQDGVTAALLSQVEKDLADYERYIIYPPDHEDIINDAYESVSKKIKKMYIDAMLEVAQRSVERWKEAALEKNKTE